MSAKVAIVFYSGTGNTESMASAVAEGVRSVGGTATVISPDTFGSDMLDTFDAIAFGCPSMGVEVLEEEIFEPMFQGIEGSLTGRKTALFGSYGWGDGEWMRDWEERTKGDGAILVGKPVIANEAPDHDALEQCRDLGKLLATP